MFIHSLFDLYMPWLNLVSTWSLSQEWSISWQRTLVSQEMILISTWRSFMWCAWIWNQFPFSLANSAKEWLYYLPSGTITTWNEIKKLFLEKILRCIKGGQYKERNLRHSTDEWKESLWVLGVLKKLCASCPHHQISEQLFIQYFYEGLMPIERSMIDAASGRVLVD